MQVSDSVEIEIITHSTEETLLLGKEIGGRAYKGLVIALNGEMGAGKTKLTQGIAKGLDVPGDYRVTSPTFTIINEYPGRFPLHHIDLYRISDPEGLFELGYEEYFYGDAVVVIEWAERARALLPSERVDTVISIVGNGERKFDFSFKGNGNIALVKALQSFREAKKGGQ